MSSADLKAQYQAVEDQMLAVAAEKDEAMLRYRDQLRELQVQARDAQKAYLDAEAAEALVGQPDAEAVAGSLGLTLPDAVPEV